MKDENYDVKLSGSWNVEKKCFIKPLTFIIEPVSMRGKVSDFYIDIEIKMSNGDKITYYFKGDECPINVDKCEMYINGNCVYDVNSEKCFLDEIREKYLKYLFNKTTITKSQEL